MKIKHKKCAKCKNPIGDDVERHYREYKFICERCWNKLRFGEGHKYAC